jgi:HSP20 family protein
MTFVNVKNKPFHPAFNNLVNDLFPQFSSIYRDEANSAKGFIPVNISQHENGYTLEVVAPGFNKEDFSVKLEENILTISALKPEASEESKKTVKAVRSEYRFGSFKRSFTVDEHIDTENIAAAYVNGVLTLNLGKKEEVKAAAKQITIQ